MNALDLILHGHLRTTFLDKATKRKQIGRDRSEILACHSTLKASHRGIDDDQEIISSGVSVLTFCSILTAFQTGFAQQQSGNSPAANPLLRLLQAKGIVTEEEAAQIDRMPAPDDANQGLAQLLLSKGVISLSDYDQAFGAAKVFTISAPASPGANVVPAVYRMPVNSPASDAPVNNLSVAATARSNAAPAPPEGPTAVPAITPLRVFPVGGLAKGEMKPMISLGNLHITPYGFIKATFVHDSSSPGGDDFPLPGFMSDTGPQGSERYERAVNWRRGKPIKGIVPALQQRDPMNRINWNRVLLGGLLSGVIINVSEFITNGVVLSSQWEVAMKPLGRSLSSSALTSFAILGFVSGIAVVLLYATARPRFGPGAKTAVLTGFVFWIIGYGLPSLGFSAAGLLPTRLLLTGTVVSLVEVILASVAGAWLYKE